MFLGCATFLIASAHREGRGGTSYTPSNDFANVGHKNAIKHEIRETP